MSLMKRQKRNGARNFEAWESWPLVDGADTVDVVGPELFRRFLVTAKEVASSESRPANLDKDDVAFCREVAVVADDMLSDLSG
jgi:hypothetical protein